MTISYNSNYNETIPFSDTDIQIACQANAALSYTVPGSDLMQYQAYFSYTQQSNVFVCKNSAPTIPSNGTVGTQQYNEFKPIKRYVKGGDVLYFITPDTLAYIGVSLRQLQG